jgi:hypothetical protein
LSEIGDQQKNRLRLAPPFHTNNLFRDAWAERVPGEAIDRIGGDGQDLSPPDCRRGKPNPIPLKLHGINGQDVIGANRGGHIGILLR